ncbi:hypothetical protein M9H77_04755 [Catharanthus roseus]|uniref:Uncharacterized protein n=1 Tax=Catharanthus roseus TaxID=4058 RepID=A0ACC0CEY7_CATRO|nr:hypothetical protein M9H77_04755 [Catharanthus roseus]
MPSDQGWPTLAVEVLSYPNDEYIRWYRGITRVYIENPANRDTHSVGYQLAGVDRRIMEVDDMASVVIQELPSSLSQMAVFAKKVQTIIWRCMISIGGMLGCTPSQYDINRHFQYNCRVIVLGSPYWRGVLVELRGALVDSLVVEHEVDALLSLIFQADTDMQTPDMILRAPPPLGLGFFPFQSHNTSLEFSSSRAPPPPGTADSSTLHQFISQASSSDKEE